MTITRRESLTLASASIAAATIPTLRARAAVTDVPTANVKPLEYKLEKGAELRVLRPAKFIDPDEVYWRENTKKYTDATGIPVRVDFISWEDIRPQTAVVANTGAGPDIVVGFSSDPQIYASKIADMTDLADYLGAKYGGWQELSVLYGTKWKTKDWISIPIGGGAGPVVYRQSWVKQAGYDKIPDDHQGFLALCQKLHAAGHPFGMSLGHALGDANGFASWLLWSHNAMLVDENGKIALDSKETVAALRYATELQKVQVSGNLSWNDSGNNKAYAAGDIGMTFNGVSIYYFLKTSPDPKLQQMAVDTQHQLLPKGVASRSPMSATPMNAMVFKHTKYPNAAKDYLRFMMEADQYGPWLSNCIGYWSNSLKAYSKMKFWTEDPKLAPYASGMDTPYYDGYKGPVTPASSAVTANYTVVDMFASVVTGNATPEAAAKRGAQQAQRYYKS
ncbi:ABC transporter substrate-binding protein [Rhodopila sp.]|jgi:multiple sugar transport system substrate-binding protein|uniref:ABC transporter substrate-binding protein n=1 Tax=Rhodopila sp. TaxID=2480087 RepID=UPI002CB79FFD|nr:ABC transporter substrate-binding protein [Rhodopila sp.]HVZ07476.1 ABC transporter substrate-binding protein [Rhodopila sp.]